jgi:hypothetical protein
MNMLVIHPQAWGKTRGTLFSDTLIIYEGYTLWLFNIAMENCPFIDDL